MSFSSIIIDSNKMIGNHLTIIQSQAIPIKTGEALCSICWLACKISILLASSATLYAFLCFHCGLLLCIKTKILTSSTRMLAPLQVGFLAFYSSSSFSSNTSILFPLCYLPSTLAPSFSSLAHLQHQSDSNSSSPSYGIGIPFPPSACLWPSHSPSSSSTIGAPYTFSTTSTPTSALATLSRAVWGLKSWLGSRIQSLHQTFKLNMNN